MKTKIKVVLGILALAVIGVTLYFSNTSLQKGKLQDARRQAAPDLKITALSVLPTNPRVGDQITISASVRATGSTAATTTSLQIDSVAQPPLPGASTGRLNNSSEIETWTWTAIEGTHVIQSCADAGLIITESDERNNCSNTTITVIPVPACTTEQYTCGTWSTCSMDGNQTGSSCAANSGITCVLPSLITRVCTPRFPDLTIEDVTFTQTPYECRINANVMVRNNGNSDATAQTSSNDTVRLTAQRIDNIGNVMATAPETYSMNGGTPSAGFCSSSGYCTFSLPSGNSTTINTTTPPGWGWVPRDGELIGGGVGFRFTADYTNKIAESNEINNARDVIIPADYLACRPTDLTVSNAQVTGYDTDGLFADFRATTENLGTTNITNPFSLSLLIDVGTTTSSGGWSRNSVGTVPNFSGSYFIRSQDYAIDTTITELAGQSSIDDVLRWNGNPGAHTFTVCANSTRGILEWRGRPLQRGNILEANTSNNCSPIQEFILSGPL